MKVVLYSAMTGGYDTIKPLPDNLGCDTFLFVEQPVEAKNWGVRVVVKRNMHPRMRAKWYKLHPHLCFRSYDASVWIDSSVLVTNPDFVREAVAYLEKEPMVFFPHRWRTRIDEEAEESLKIPKYWGLPLREQVASYYADGYQDQVRLVECTCLIRLHNDERVVAFNEAWWKENETWSYADQLSAPYLLWKMKTPFAYLPFTIAEQKWFQITTWRADR